jgi:hypothetical protein
MAAKVIPLFGGCDLAALLPIVSKLANCIAEKVLAMMPVKNLEEIHALQQWEYPEGPARPDHGRTGQLGIDGGRDRL